MTDDKEIRVSPDGRERRFFSAPDDAIEMREDGDGRAGIRGLGVPVDVEADVGPFTESVAPEAVEDLVERGLDIRGLFNHSPNFVLGRTKSGTMEVRKTDRGAEYDIPELPDSREDVREAIDRGDVDGNSWSFKVPEDGSGEEWDESRDKPHRRIVRFADVFDMGPVTFPAYEGMTTISQRCATMAGECEPETREDAGEGSTPIEKVTVKIDADVDDFREKMEQVQGELRRVTARPAVQEGGVRWTEMSGVRWAMDTITDWHTRARSVPRTADELVFDGTTEDEWSSPNVEDFADAFGWEAESVEDLSDEQREQVASHSLIGEADAETFDELVSFPVVEPGGPLSRNALVNAKARARFAPDPDALQARVDELLAEFYGEEEENEGMSLEDAEKRINFASLRQRVAG